MRKRCLSPFRLFLRKGGQAPDGASPRLFIYKGPQGGWMRALALAAASASPCLSMRQWPQGRRSTGDWHSLPVTDFHRQHSQHWDKQQQVPVPAFPYAHGHTDDDQQGTGTRCLSPTFVDGVCSSGDWPCGPVPILLSLRKEGRIRMRMP